MSGNRPYTIRKRGVLVTKKVFELAKEMGLKSRELIEKAEGFDMHIKSHMSVLSDADVEKIKKNIGNTSSKAAPAGKKIPVGTPIIDEDFLAKKKMPPMGKPVVDEAMLSRRENESSTEEDVKAEDRTVAKSETLSKVQAVQEGKVTSTVKSEKETVAGSAKKEDSGKPEKSNKAVNEENKISGNSQEGKPKNSKDKTHKSDSKKEVTKTKKEAPEEVEKEMPKSEESTVKTIDSERIFMPKIKIISKAEDTRKKEAEAKKEVEARREARAEEKNKKERRKTGDRSHEDGDRRRNKSSDRPSRKKDGDRRGESRDTRESRDLRNKKDSRDSRGDRNDRRPSKNNDSSKGGGRVEDTGMASGKSRTRRDERKGHGKNEERSKFDKLERKSLEKRERKKYTKPKQEVEEEIIEEVLPEGTVKINVPITVAGFCEQAEVSTSNVIMALMKMGIMANINQNLDEDTLMVLAEELGISVVIGTVKEEVKEEGIEDFTDREKDLKDRSPIITVMGHVDHGKTSLLDAIRSTNVTSTESGGITQHIGASEVSINGQKIVFLDTPGHEAFTAMRARGAHVTDIAVLVVAADDSVKPQTIESISHAKAAGVPIIVAINKMDKPGANPDTVKKDLADHGVLVEDWGGDVICVPVSAKTGEGITNLLEMILLQAEVLELKANPNRLAMGSVIEAKLDKNRGPVASLLILNGTLQAGQSIVAGTCSGRIRLMTNDKGEKLKKSGPATAVEILGLTEVPQAGDEFNAVRDDKVAREIAEHRKEKLRAEVLAKNSSMTLDKLFSQIKEGETKELNLIIKGDVQGSVGALISSLEKLNNDEVKVNVVHSGVGTISESDIMLAGTSDAVIIGFNVRPTTAITTAADQNGVEIRLYRVIYDVINDVEAAMKGMLDPEFKEEVLGKAEVRNTFKVPGIGIIAGAYIIEGKVVRNKEIRLVRDGIVIHEGKISSLKRFKDDAKEVNQGYECGIGIESYNDLKDGDIIECFTMVEIERK